MNDKWKRFKPLILSLAIIIVDQITKALIVKTIGEESIGWRSKNDFLWIVHVRNNAVAFSLGENAPIVLKYVLFVALPLVAMAVVCYLVVSKKYDKEFSTLERWCLAGILGGGCGNLIDRLFRSLRVVDFISVKFYGLFGLERFPTWNVADSAVVVSVILLLLSFIIKEIKGSKKNGRKEKD